MGLTAGLIELSGVERVYRRGANAVHALAGIDLEIGPGEYVAIVGTSGSGKSTLMNVLGCLDTPTAGRYRLEGAAVETLGDDALAHLRNTRIGFVFQTFHLLPRADAVRNVEPGTSAAERRRRAVERLEQVGLGDRLDHRPNELSGGQCQRVAIARALVNRPSLILADEPTGHLDSKTSEEIMGLFDALHRQGTTLVLVTHEDDIARHAERRVRLEDGRVVEDVRTRDPDTASETSRRDPP